MKIIDANLLIYAVNADSPHHARVKPWWESLLSGKEHVALPWVVILAFLRITTNERVFPRPLSAEQALSLIVGWLEQPFVTLLAAGDGVLPVFKGLLLESGTAGNLTTDAFLAALAMEQDATLCSADHDFNRYRGLKLENPTG